jgi:hypothetical protein
LLAPIQVDRLGDLPEHDPDDRHRLVGDEVLVVQRGTLGMPIGQELVLAGLRPGTRRGSPAALPVSLLQPFEDGPQVGVRLATGSDPTPVAGVWFATGVLR